VNERHRNRLLTVEHHGVDAVPKAERTKGWADLFVMYTGLNIAMVTLLVGGLMVPALSWSEVVFVVIVGHMIVGLLMSLMGHMGVDHGIPAAVMSRSFLGYPVGTGLCSVALLLALTGWFAVNAEIGGMAIDKLTSAMFGFSSPRLMILILGVGNVIVSVIGIESIKWLSRLSVPLLLAIMAWLAATILSEYSLIGLVTYEATGALSVNTAIDWMVGGLVVGIFIAADISRHVRSRRDNWIGIVLGVVPSSVFLVGLGALTSLATGHWNPVDGIEALGLGAPALFVIIFSTWTTNDLNLYSGGLALTNILPALSRWQNTLILGAAGTILAMMRITEHFTTFLELLANIFAPLVGVALTDYFVVRRSRLDPSVVYEGSSRALYSHGVNLVAWAVVIVGTVVAVLTPEDLVASLVSMFVSAGLYWVLMRMIHPAHFVGKASAQHS
jgi:putative hydroxymethylpyrimidine transporter CytX